MQHVGVLVVLASSGFMVVVARVVGGAVHTLAPADQEPATGLQSGKEPQQPELVVVDEVPDVTQLVLELGQSAQRPPQHGREAGDVLSVVRWMRDAAVIADAFGAAVLRHIFFGMTRRGAVQNGTHFLAVALEAAGDPQLSLAVLSLAVEHGTLFAIFHCLGLRLAAEHRQG
uniref:Putative secreted protein n=1 Tax=Ixodes ricinus TaxID=34613 RepID=A0A6B0UYQ2_IXORI